MFILKEQPSSCIASSDRYVYTYELFFEWDNARNAHAYTRLKELHKGTVARN